MTSCKTGQGLCVSSPSKQMTKKLHLIEKLTTKFLLLSVTLPYSPMWCVLYAPFLGLNYRSYATLRERVRGETHKIVSSFVVVCVYKGKVGRIKWRWRSCLQTPNKGFLITRVVGRRNNAGK